MACESELIRKRWVGVMMVIFSTLLHQWVTADHQPQVPCYFIFGDSLVDSGNNNFLPTLAKANFPPHGIDFLGGPTGRFCNGRNIVDITAELMGFKDYIPPFASVEDSDILLGVSYASSGGGIRNETARHLGARISFDGQLENHRSVVSRLAGILGDNKSAENYLNKCLYYVGLGGNDYLNNYFLPEEYSTSRVFSPKEFALLLIEQYQRQILTLYKYGARKIALYGLGPIGCTPNEIAHHDTNGSPCVDNINTAIQLFNNLLIALVIDLNNNSSLTDAKFIYVNLYDMSMEVILNPFPFGIRVTDSACCGVGQNKGVISCLPLEIPCRNRSEYFFWDAYHPTEAANVIAAGRAYKALRSSDVYPFDIQHLVEL